jgi:hypothetical protein
MSTRTTITLREYTDEMLALDALVDLDEGEWTDDAQQLADELLAKLATKIDDLVEYRASLATRARDWSETAKAIAAKAKREQQRVEWIDRYMLEQLERMGRDTIAGTLWKVRRQKNPASVLVEVLPNALPAAYVRVIPEQREPDKKAIADAMRAGEHIDGCCWAPDTYHLRVS